MVVKTLAPFSHKNSWQMFIPPYHPVILTKLHGCYANPVWWFTYHKWWFSIANCDRLPDGLVCLRSCELFNLAGTSFYASWPVSKMKVCGRYGASSPHCMVWVVIYFSIKTVTRRNTCSISSQRTHTSLKICKQTNPMSIIWMKNISNIVRTVRKCQENTSPQRNK